MTEYDRYLERLLTRARERLTVAENESQLMRDYIQMCINSYETILERRRKKRESRQATDAGTDG